MKVFVIIVTYNGAKWLDKCIGNTLNGAVKPNIIVIDNNSSDNTVEIIEKNYPEVQLIKSKDNFGFGKANNIGIKIAYEAGADYFLLLNQDAWIENDTIAKLIQAHSAQPEFDILSPMHMNGKGDALDFNFSTYIAPSECKYLYSDIFTDQVKSKLYETTFVNAACWLLTRKCIETVGGFSPVFYHYAEDNNYINRVHYHGLRVGVYPLSKVFHDREQTNSSSYYSKDQLQTRRLTLKYSDPNYKSSLKDEISKNNSYLKRALLKLNFKKVNELKETITELEKLNQLIETPLLKSKQIGLNFID